MSVIFIILSVLTFRQAATWKDGAALWDQAISIAPSSRAYSNRGLLYKWENNPDQALEMFNKAISINKAEKDALVNRGNIYFNRQQFEKAIADYNICLSIDSTMVKAIENRGSAYGALGKYELALIDLDKAIQLNPETENGYANRAVTYQMLNRNQEAIADFYRQMEVNHLESADILNSIAVLYTRLKDYDKAIDVLSKAIAKESKGVYYLNLAVVYREQGRNADARSAANKAISLGAKVDSNFMNSIQ
jgi:tetratricopeptide (TPR) repeat protein